MASLVSSNGSAIDGAGFAVVAGQIGCVLKARTATGNRPRLRVHVPSVRRPPLGSMAAI